ncbi:hypothetical protein TSUD_236430 [Trifolium subterraneum]|nr:hypothetical protein TSUD_236430 [Trifolium subterraneum]
MVSDDETGTCAVCLGDFEEGEELRTMPECFHSFHVPCIDMWLHSHLSCPICRASAAPLPAVKEHSHIIDVSHNMAPLAIMQNNDGDNPFSDKVVILLIAMGAAAFVVSIYHIIAIWFCHQGRTTTNLNSPRHGAASLDESTSISVADLIPTHKYHKRSKVDVVSDDEGGTCAVCLGDFEEGEELKTMPECLHSFHVPCIDLWLNSHSSCPICRASAAPSPAMNIEHQHMIDMRHTPPIAIV